MKKKYFINYLLINVNLLSMNNIGENLIFENNQLINEENNENPPLEHNCLKYLKKIKCCSLYTHKYICLCFTIIIFIYILLSKCPKN